MYLKNTPALNIAAIRTYGDISPANISKKNTSLKGILFYSAAFIVIVNEPIKLQNFKLRQIRCMIESQNKTNKAILTKYRSTTLSKASILFPWEVFTS